MRRWVGLSAIWLQILISGVCWYGVWVIGLGLRDSFTDAAFAVYEHRVAALVIMALCFPTAIGLGVFIVLYLWPVTVVVDSRGVLVQRRGRKRFVEWGDVESVDFSKAGYGTYGGVRINVKSGAGGGKGSVGLPGACFSTRQLEEMSSMIEKAVKRERMDLLREEGAHHHHEGAGHA